MKKLLLLGALLVVGATSFSAVTAQPVSKQSVELTGTTGSYDGEVELNLVTKGNIVAPSEGTYMLVVRPTQSAEVSSDSIVFNFTDLRLGERDQMVGGFEAQIYANNSGTITEVELYDPANGGTIQDNRGAISAELVYLGGDTVGTDPNVNVIVNASGNSIQSIKLKSLADGTTQLGTLDYGLTTNFPSTKVFAGNIVADVEASNTNSGSFRNLDAKVIIKVEGANLTEPTKS